MKLVRWLAPLSAALLMAMAAIATPATVSATPSAGVEATTISASTVDGIDYITREITIAPGGSTGWHYHNGRIYGLIREGTLTHDAANCGVDGIYPTGAPITEASGESNVHIGRNLGPGLLVMWVLYIQPAGIPLSMDAPDPGCGFA